MGEEGGSVFHEKLESGEGHPGSVIEEEGEKLQGKKSRQDRKYSVEESKRSQRDRREVGEDGAGGQGVKDVYGEGDADEKGRRAYGDDPGDRVGGEESASDKLRPAASLRVHGPPIACPSLESCRHHLSQRK